METHRLRALPSETCGLWSGITDQVLCSCCDLSLMFDDIFLLLLLLGTRLVQLRDVVALQPLKVIVDHADAAYVLQMVSSCKVFSTALVTHLVDFHNNHQFVVFQIHLVSFSHDVCDLLDYAVARQNIVIAYRRPNCKLHGKKSQPPHASISHTLICSPSSSWTRPGERAHKYIPYAPGKVLDESAERELSTPPARDPRCWLDPSMSWV